MSELESKAKGVQAALGLLSRAAGSDGFQVDVEYKTLCAIVRCFPYTEQQANALQAFVLAFIWSNAQVRKEPQDGWVVEVIVKAEGGK